MSTLTKLRAEIKVKAETTSDNWLTDVPVTVHNNIALDGIHVVVSLVPAGQRIPETRHTSFSRVIHLGDGSAVVFRTRGATPELRQSLARMRDRDAAEAKLARIEQQVLRELY